MKILKNKYYIGQKVWIILDEKPRMAKIYSVEAENGRYNNYYYGVCVKNAWFTIRRYESEIFPSKEELIASL